MSYCRIGFTILILTVMVLLSSGLAVADCDLFIEDIRLQDSATAKKIVIVVGNNGNQFPEKNVPCQIQIVAEVPDSNEKPVTINELLPYGNLAPGSFFTKVIEKYNVKKSINVTVRIDPANIIKETSESNNTREKKLVVLQEPASGKGGLPNLEISRLYPVPYSGNRVYFRVHIRNSGNAFPGSDFNVVMKWTPMTGGQPNIWKQKEKMYPPGSEVILSSGYIKINPGQVYNFEVTIDPENRVQESNEADNVKMIAYP
ncbi:MAG: hypothetical protein JW737_09685 [Acidobacteria bacterium]|nr:hypothetical protein [Acidobacteriota bacterium]